jgi:hypothetical protein
MKFLVSVLCTRGQVMSAPSISANGLLTSLNFLLAVEVHVVSCGYGATL